ncbi:unnamed protein product [Mortierella alpina]
MATTRNSTPDCAIDVPIDTFEEDDSIIQLRLDGVSHPRPLQELQKCDLCRQERCVHVSSAREIAEDLQEHDPEEIMGCAHKWYFKEAQAGAVHAESANASTRAQSAFQCTEEYQPPMRREASIRYTSWLLNTDACMEKKHTITLAVSTKNLQIDGIESITFSLSSDFGKSYYSIERITRQRLQSLIIPTTGMSKWQLHRELDASACKGDQLITMEVRLSNETLFSQLDPGSVEIQYIELNSHKPSGLGRNDPFLRVHAPQLLSLDIEHKDSRFLYIAFSGNGECLVSLRTTMKQLLVEFWDLRYLDASDTPGPPQSPTKAFATLYIPLARDKDSKGEVPEYPFQISMSWDATQIAIAFTGHWHQECPLIKDFQDYFGLYRTSATERSYQPSLSDYQNCKRLHNFGGGAKFHITAAENQDVRNELYIACTGQEVQVYSVYGRWILLRTITLIPPTENPHSEAYFAWGVLERLQGRFFLWYDNANNDMVIWDLEKGAVVSYFAKKGPCTLWTMHEDDVTGISKDGSTLAFYRQGEITTYRMATGTLLSSRLLPPGYEDVTDVKFIRKDGQILVCARAQDEDYGAGNLGLILDVATLSIEGRFVVPSGTLFVRYSSRERYNSIYSIESELSTLELTAVKDLVRTPYSLQHLARHEPCLGTLAPLGTNPTEFTSSTGLAFTARIAHSADTLREFESPSVIVLVRALGGSRTFVIPPLPESTDMFGDIDFGRTYRSAVFLDSFSRLIVQSRDFLMIWGLPTTLEADFVLLLAWSTSRLPTDSRWLTCAHRQLYNCRTLPGPAVSTKTSSSTTYFYPDIDHPFSSSDKEYFLDGILIAMEIYDRANEVCKQAILRYLSRYINSYPVSDDPSANVVSKICHAWTPELRTSYRQFTEELLSSGFTRWVPRLDMDRQWNPLGILLQKCKTEPRAMGLAQVIIDYCVCQATKDRDLSFVRPFTQCLDEFGDQKKSHWKLALSTLQRIAFIPAKDRSFVVDNHAIAYPVTARFQWKLWKAQLPPLYKCKDPVLQLMHVPDRKRNAQNDNFTRGLYITSFDLLWRPRPDRSSRLSLRSEQHPERDSRVQLGIKLSWINVLVQLIRLKFKLKSSKAAIDCHDLQLEAFDNPALAALIEYKWNTIGFKYWLARFLFQCCFYALVLTTVFMQVYGISSDVLPGMSIAIIVFACVFLWLELSQLLRDWRRYLSSVYNYVDLAAFGLPLAGSINQLMALLSKDGSTSRSEVLSFSILFVFLHILFELRINRSVCHYVTIIIRIFSEIRAFFLIFAGGIFAFTIAILHLLYACLGDVCPQPIDGGFPLHFYKAISSTYFFMGGRYDSINGDLDSDNWAFHTMMIIYFFFTVILMLNVLIGLVNLAFNDGDRTWRLVWLENRLRYIESAESLSYKVPGFRQTSSWFPDEIYYSATPQEIKEYRKRWAGDDYEAVPLPTKITPLLRPESSSTQLLTPTPNTAIDSRQNLQELKGQLQEEFKRELQVQLTEQRREQQLLFEAQIKMLQEHMSTLMKSVP